MERLNNCLESLNSSLYELSDYITEKTGCTLEKQAKIAAVVAGVVGAIFAIAALGSLAAAPISSAVVLVFGLALAVLARDAFVVLENEEKKGASLKGKFMSLIGKESEVSLDNTSLLKRLV
jgi:hypothetical protein